MKTIISNLILAVKAEHIKKKGIGIYNISKAIAVLSPILLFVIELYNDQTQEEGLLFNFYEKFILSSASGFVVFFFPLLIIINASRIAQIDHKNGGWQLMEVQPLQKFSLYFSKFIVLIFSNIIAILSFFISAILLAWVLHFFVEIPATAIAEFPLQQILNLLIRILAASVFLTAFQYMLSALLSSYTWPLLIGFSGLMLPLILLPFGVTAPDWFPFEIFNRTAKYNTGSDIGNLLLYTEKISLLLGLFFLIVGFVWYKSKSFKKAFLHSTKNIAASAACLIVFGVALFLLLKPNIQNPYTDTIICGNIESDVPSKHAYIIRPLVEDTLAKVELTDGKFKQKISGEVFLNQYKLVFENSFSTGITFSQNDSLQLQLKYYNGKSDIKVTGTRLAENQTSNATKFGWSEVEYMLKDNKSISEPSKFFKVLSKEWKEAYYNAKTFKTTDNFVPRPDFLEVSRKLVCITYLNYLNKFLDARAALFPNEKTDIPRDIQTIQSKVSLHEEALIGYRKYIDYLMYELTKNDKREIDEMTKGMDALTQLESSNFKSKLIFHRLKTNLEEATNNEDRSRLINNYKKEINDAKLQSYIQNYYEIYERLGKGNPAKEIVMTNLKEEVLRLSDFKGKFVVIDVWATWCAPCRYQSPFFEKLAIKYSKENIQFIALSVDKDYTKWYVAAKSKTGTVLQTHARDMDIFIEDYNVAGIPRFILIDTEGRIYNAELPLPSEQSFEMIVRKVLKLNDMD